MEKETLNITKEELNDFMRQIDGIKSTVEILQNRELMRQIEESEELKKRNINPFKIDVQ